MKYLSEGFEYKVYDMGNGKVFKRQIGYFNRLYKIFKITRDRGFSLSKSIKTAFKSDRKNRLAFRVVKVKLEDIPRKLFGNPEFSKNGKDFTQDKIMTVEECLNKLDDQAVERIIDEYVDFQQILWSHGMHDQTYKFQPNYGIKSNGKLVCIDFGEFVFTKDEALGSIHKRKWLTRTSYKKWEDSVIKRYYTKKMDECMTTESLEKYWGRGQRV